MARTQKNKATSNHLGLLKAKLAKLRRELLTPSSGGGGGPGGEDFYLDTIFLNMSRSFQLITLFSL